MHHRFARSDGNIAIVSESVIESVLIPRHSRQLGLSCGTLWPYPYKVQLTQQLKPADHSQRRRYVEWVLEEQVVDGNFSNKICFNDEAHFRLDGYGNKQNCRI